MIRRIPGILAVCSGVFLAGVALAVPSFAGTNPPASQTRAPHKPPAADKPQPVQPRHAPGTATGSALPAKPARRAGAAPAAGAADAWSVGLTANATMLWPTQYVTLTATSNMDVGPTPYYLRIYDVYDGTYVGSCGAGTTCSLATTQTVPVVHLYRAVVSDGSATVPPAVQVATSIDVSVDWRTLVDNLQLKLAAQPSTSSVGAQVTLTATAAEDVGPSPFYFLLFDATTLTFLGRCGFGMSCSITVSQPAAATHMYAAYVGASTVDTYPTGQQPHYVVATAGFVYATWADTGWTVALTASTVTDNSQTLTASTKIDVGPTPYYIEIFALPFNHLIAVCGSGTSCTATVPVDYLATDVQAFVMTYATSAFPFPATAVVQASSNVVNN
jgi:hypothetical protein